MAIAFVYSFVLNINMASNEVKPNIACIAHICMRMTIFFFTLAKHVHSKYITFNYHTFYDTEQTPHIYTDIQKDTSGTFPRSRYPICTRDVMSRCNEGKVC